MSDMSGAIVPKSDQWNADDFQAGPITFTIRSVTVKGGQEQPVAIAVDGSEKVYRPCKSMNRVLVAAWGADSSKYVGRSLTLYCDPKVRWGGMEVGGIRISHMSDIDSALTMALTVTRANKKPFTVKPIVRAQPKAEAQTAGSVSPGTDAAPAASLATSAASAPKYITDDQALALEARCMDNNIPAGALKSAAKVERFAMIEAQHYDRAVTWIDNVLAARKAKAAT